MSPLPQPKGLISDPEVVSPKNNQPTRIMMVGALRSDLGAESELKVSGDPSPVLRQLDTLSDGVGFVFGHNVINHDLPILHERFPGMALHALPIIDALHLSLLAFPQSPCHRLIKDYRLIRNSLNSPLSDCRSTLVLFLDQRQAFTQLSETSQTELLCYQTLLAPSMQGNLEAFFASLTGRFPVSVPGLRARFPQLLQETDPALQRDLRMCRAQPEQLPEEDLQREDLYWPLVYVLAWFHVFGGSSVLALQVRHQLSEAGRLTSRLRDMPCEREDCQYRQTTRDPHHEPKRRFGFPDFCYEDSGESLQHDIVLAGMRGQHVLTILVTDGGKSLCYQLPALNRSRRNGSLTIIVSPL